MPLRSSVIPLPVVRPHLSALLGIILVNEAWHGAEALQQPASLGTGFAGREKPDGGEQDLGSPFCPPPAVW